MKAIRYEAAHHFPVVEVADPVAGPGQVLIAPLAVGICLTDKHLHDGLSRRSRGGQIGGHEFAGRVEAVGEGVEGVSPGDLVSVDPRLACGACRFCHAGLVTLCKDGPRLLGVNPGLDGGLADRCVVPDYALHLLPAGLTPVQAASAEPACCATRAIRHGGVRIGDNVVVLGAEDYGLAATSWLRSAGADAVVVVDPNENRRVAARAGGATAVLDPREDVRAAVAELLPFGADVVIVNMEDYVSESDEYLALAGDVCRPQGSVITVRAYGPQPYARLTAHPLWLKELTLKHFGVFFGDEPVQGGKPRGDWALTLRAMADGRLISPPVGHTVVPFAELGGPADVARMMATLPAQSTKAIVVMES